MSAHNLSNLEQEVMEIIWHHSECAVGDIIKERTGKKKLAYTTIATIVDRLYGKKFLVRFQKGKRYLYSPKVSKEEFGKYLATSFLQRFIQNFGDVAIASFAESIDELPQKKRHSLIQKIARYEKK